MYSPENQTKNYSQLFNDIDTGLVKIPQFQRDFVWEKEQTAKLVDSIDPPLNKEKCLSNTFFG